MRRCPLVIGILALGVVGLAGRAASADAPPDDRPAQSFIGAMDALKTFNTDVCTAESPAVFDVKEIGRRALGRHSQDHSKGEVAEFGGLVARRFLRWYAGVLHRGRSGPSTESSPDPIFGTGTAVGSWATIAAITPRRRRTFVYHLRWTDDGSWRVYDIEIDGRSRAVLYYTEFDRIILNEGYRVLAGRITAEVARDDAARTAFDKTRTALDAAARTACATAASETCKKAERRVQEHARGCRNSAEPPGSEPTR